MIGAATAVLAAVVFGLAAVAQAAAVRRDGARPDTLVGFVRWAAADGLMLAVIVAYLAGFVLHAVAIWLTPLYVAQATIALSLPVTALAARGVAESASGRLWAWVGVAVAGLALVGLGAGDPGPSRDDWTISVPAVVGVVVLGLATLRLAAGRSAGTTGGAAGGLLGVLAGLGYAGSALAVRGVDLPLTPSVLLTALTVPAYGVLAFWSYSLAMTETAVTAATAPMIALQTLVPALVGVVLLGDQVRDGWAPAVVAGVALTTAAAIAISRSRSAVATVGSG